MTTNARPTCYRCHKPSALCICADTPRVANRTSIRILQHPRERFHPIGTVRFAELGLEDSVVLVDHPRDRESNQARLIAGKKKLGLLYPSKTARPLSDLRDDERPDGLILLDGTWSQAKVLYRDNHWLHGLPHYAVTPPAPSLYRLRAEPFEQAVSTIEAIVLALESLEPELGRAPAELLGAFVRMIDVQIELGKKRVGRQRGPKNRRENRAIPRDLRAPADRIVLVFGELAPGVQERKPQGEVEGSARPSRRRAVSEANVADGLISWTAMRLGDRSTFERHLRPERLPSARHLEHMGLPTGLLESGISVPELQRAWTEFVRPGDVIVAWNQSTLGAFGDTFETRDVSTVLVKVAYANARHTGNATGSLGEVMAREQFSPHEMPFRGRAALVMGQLSRLVELLRSIESS